MADILHQVGIQASREAVFDALTKQDGLRAWWSEHSTIQPTVGSLARVSFYNNAVTFELRVAELEPGHKVIWTVEGGPPDWLGTKITWTLSQNNGQTMLHLTHAGFESTGGNFASVNYNWGWYITSLLFYLQKGEGMPHTDADLPG